MHFALTEGSMICSRFHIALSKIEAAIASQVSEVRVTWPDLKWPGKNQGMYAKKTGPKRGAVSVFEKNLPPP